MSYYRGPGPDQQARAAIIGGIFIAAAFLIILKIGGVW